MEQQISFCITPDGTRVAYAEYGPPSGPALVVFGGYDIGQESVWSLPDGKAFLEDLAGMRRLITFDYRGLGASQRDVGPNDRDVDLADLEYLADHLGLTEFDLFAIWPDAATYAARHPARVTRLILWAPTLTNNAFPTETLAMIRTSWGLYTRAIATVIYPGGPPEALRWISDAVRRSCTSDYYITTVSSSHDYRPDLMRVRCPTLVLHPTDTQDKRVEEGREVAALIPGAKFVSLQGVCSLPFWDRGRYMQTVRDFLLVPGTSGRTDANTLVAGAGSGPASFASERYAVVRPLGEGGQKSVYLVHDNALDRDCALALIRSDDLGPDELLRFQREAQAMARLGAHSNIVSVFDIGEQDGRPYLVSEYIAGGDLRRLLLKQGRLPLAEAIAVGSDIARALAVAHARGVVHRDVKPLNIWLTEDGSAKLGDFGLAFSVDRSRLTMPGTVMGTAAYLAPEQALGEAVTERSDLYALGCVLYEMVCGRPPFVDSNATAVIAQHLHAVPAAPSSHEPDVPRALEDLMMRLLAKSPVQRPESASAVLEELRRIGDAPTPKD